MENSVNSGAGASSSNIKYYTPEEDKCEDCPVCLEDFNDTSVINVKCGCGFSACVECIKEYLIQTTKDPHCMKCNRAWDRDFQYSCLSPKWINGKYRSYRKQLLLEREKARLPETQLQLEEYENEKVYDNKIKEINLDILKLKKQLDTINKQTKILNNKLCEIKNTKQYLILEKHNVIIEKHNVILEKALKNKTSIKKNFLHKCPNEDCRGFLSIGYKCKLCKTDVCSKCFIIKNKASIEKHKCNPNDVKTTNAIKKETRPCPKCAVRIFKISGCDQMWCTQCNIAFSWKSGLEVGGIVHNPHYYDWMRKQNLSGIRIPGEIVCGGIPQYHIVLNAVNWYTKYIVDKTLDLGIMMENYYRGLAHINYSIIEPLRERINRANDNSDIRMRYLTKEINEKRFASIICRRDNVRQKNVAMLRVFEMYNTLMIERFNNFINLYEKEWSSAHKKALKELIETPTEIRNYCNEELKKISKNYNMKVNIITKDFSTCTRMFKY